MRKLEITLTEEQYQHIVAERSYGNRTNLEEETFGGYELCLHVGSPDVFPATLEMKMMNTIDLGEVEWKFSKI
ncbi:hypothetical protein [Christiangramia forsetii]|uniref:Uncharacterized protein n=2 Tax=Christiangramia forsetii TaxID=411153 RepID=A0M4K5_CHRFK|nr:hypothetical protein [Christiangramia forsetii]GGG23230.1 hypothetical protein GCM10011532_02930 [Christiangramia forsetii]CAL67550.1 hypothetical protein GFO_2594 [Christiangramia forsetii KT0803]